MHLSSWNLFSSSGHNLDTQPHLRIGLSRLVLPIMSPTPLTPPILHLLNENKHLNQKMSKPDIPLFALSALNNEHVDC